MGRLQSSIGLVTGTDIVGTVDQLIAISAQPRDRLLAKSQEIQGQQQQIASLTATVIGVQLAGNALGSSALYSSKSATSSNSDAVSVSTTDTSLAGEYTIQALQTAATHSVQSAQRFDSFDKALGQIGSIRLEPSGFVDSEVSLAELNGGLGVQAGSIRITDRSGARADIDLSDARTIDDVLQAINDADVDVQATTNGGKIRLVDQSGQTVSNLKVEQLGSAETAADLGLWGIDEASNTVDGKDIDLPEGTASLSGAALSQLGGGSGIGALTNLDIELADGTSASVDLSGATSLNEVIDQINQSGLEIIARVNDAGNGLRLRDVSGGNGNFTISSADDTAANLGVDTSTDGAIIVGEDLQLPSVTTDTQLSELNQGLGIDKGSFTITDSNGEIGAINITVEEIETVGELIDAINGLSIDVTASINESGDGIVITDNAGGAGDLTIADSNGSTTAFDLGIAGTAASTISGTEATTIEITADDTLESIVEKINADGRYGDASILTNDDGTYSLQIRSKQGGEGGRIGVVTDGLDLNLRTVSKGRDAVISISSDGGIPRFMTSTDGVFEDSTSGLNFTVKEVSSEPITIQVNDNPDTVISAVNRFADQYNKLIDQINEFTFFNAADNEVGLLFGSTETLRIQTGYARLLTSPIGGVGDVRSFGQIGIRPDENGKLQVNESKLRTALETNAQAVDEFFNGVGDDETASGMVDKLSDLADRYASTDGGMLITKTQTLTSQLESNERRVESMNARLEAQRELLLRNYYAMEEAIGKIQSNLSYVSGIQYISFPSE